MPVPKRVADRITSRLKAFQAVLEQQRDRDVSEADTVTLVKDLLSEVFGYDKYSELTSEHSIRGTYCDLAVKVENKLAFLLEVKAIGLELRDSHVKQAVDYSSNQGCDWVLLTNAVEWRLYNVVYKKPIDKREVAHFDLLNVNTKNEEDLEKLYLLTREGFTKSALAEYCERKDAASRYMLAAILLKSESVQSAIRRDIRRISEIVVDETTIVKMLHDEVIKRDATEGEQFESAVRRVARSSDKAGKRAGEREAAGPAVKTVATEPASIAPSTPAAI